MFDLDLPIISSAIVIGSLTHGQSFVATGSGFGTRPSDATLKYGDFSEGVSGNPLAGGWITATNSVANGSDHADDKPIYSNAFTRGQSSVSVRHFYGGLKSQGASNLRLTASAANTLYIDYYQYFYPTDSATYPTNNYKSIRVTNANGAGFGDMPVGLHGGFGNYIGDANIDFSTGVESFLDTATQTNSSEASGIDGQQVQVFNNQTSRVTWIEPSFGLRWIHQQWELKTNTIADVRDGKVRRYFDHQLIRTTDANIFWNGSTERFFDDIEIGNFSQGPWPSDGLHIYQANVFVATSWARVELGNNVVYADCTIREIQNPTSWADGSITYTVNKGGLSTGTVWEHIINSSGTVVSSVSRTIN